MSKLLTRLLLTLIFTACFCVPASPQRHAVKSNLAADVFLNPNIGFETEIAPKWTVEINAQFNGWNLSHGQKKWKHWLVMPEARLWPHNVWDGHFFGFHIFGGQYNIGGIKGLHNFLGTDFSQLSDRRYQGWGIGAGMAYGYNWILDDRWSIEAEIGIGAAFLRHAQYSCAGCGKKIKGQRSHYYIGPTKAAISVAYRF